MKRLIIIIAISNATDANSQVSKILGKTQDWFGNVQLSTDGNTPATHTACNVLLGNAKVQKIQDWANTANYPVKIYDASQYTWEQAKKDVGLMNIQSQMT